MSSGLVGSKLILVIIAVVIVGGVIIFSFSSQIFNVNNSTNSTTTPLFPPPATTTTTTTTTPGSTTTTTGSTTTTSTTTTTTTITTTSTTTTSTTTSSTSVTTSTTTINLIPTLMSISCTDVGTGFYTCKATLTSPGLLTPGNESLTWSINQGSLSPASCTLVGNSTVESCGSILAGGVYSHKFTITATYGGDYSHAPCNASFVFTTGFAPVITTPEFPFGSVVMLMTILGALAFYGFARTRNKDIAI